MASENPRRWNYTWEAQSHIPILKLFLFNPSVNPITQSQDLKIDLLFEKSLLHVSWTEHTQLSLMVPIPRVLVDLESPITFRLSDDHIEVRIVLLLPVDHPIASSFISELSLADEEIDAGNSSSNYLHPLSMDSDVKRLSSEEDVDFYCRSCSFKLTRKPIRSFVDMPSVNWREAADNWFGACCCSFGGVSEKLVANYIKSYACVEGTCLVTTTSVVLSKDDLAECSFSDVDRINRIGESGLSDPSHNFGSTNGTHFSCVNQSAVVDDMVGKLCTVQDNEKHEEPKEPDTKKSLWTVQEQDFTKDVTLHGACCQHSVPELRWRNHDVDRPVNLLAEQKSFLDGCFGNVFMFKASALSKEFEWVEFACPQCSCLLGAYPSINASDPSDGGIRLVKCNISTSIPYSSAGDLFREYTLERMFTNQLLESAKDELSFRTVVKDVKSKSLMMQIVLLNPDSWCCSGYCTEGSFEQFPKIYLQPVIKVLFSDCCCSSEFKSRIADEWETKNRADEFLMLSHPIEQLIKCLVSSSKSFPPSITSSQGFLLSVIQR